jgi:predicted outer membrane repeat protein
MFHRCLPGGGLANYGTAILNASDLTYNSADYGGGLFNNTGAVAAGTSVRFLNNVAGYNGGAIDSYGTITLTDSELDSNLTMSDS